MFDFEGETKTLKEWATHFNIKYTTLWLRINRKGLKFEEAIKEDPYNRLITFKGKSQILKDWCKELNLKYTTIVNRIHDGWNTLDAIQVPTPQPYK